MNPFALILLLGTGLGILFGPKRLGMLSFFIGCCYMTAGEGLVVGGLNLPIFRILLLLGLIRVAIEGKGLAGGVNRMDFVVFAWACWSLFASFFHVWAPGSGPKFAIGAVFNIVAFYCMIRSFSQSRDDLVWLFGKLCWVLVPVAILMVLEQLIHKNYFSVFGGVPEVPVFRNGKFRAQGPFSHAILAGTVGAGCIPLALAVWRDNRITSIAGLTACFSMVLSSASSGPLLSVLAGIFAMALWSRRILIRYMLRAALPVYFVLSLLMERPPYYLISKLDLTGASTGWHRSFLIEQTIKHLDEWWLFGTDFTRHWMPSQGRISENHTDITNQYIAYGVNAGLLGMILVIVAMVMAFRVVGRLASDDEVDPQDGFFFWLVGCSLFAHAASAVSVAYFGQASVFFWLPIASMASFYHGMPQNAEATEPCDVGTQTDRPCAAASS